MPSSTLSQRRSIRQSVARGRNGTERRSVSPSSDTSSTNSADQVPIPSEDGGDSPRAVYDEIIEDPCATNIDTMIWREDSGRKYKMPLLPPALSSTKLRLDIPMEEIAKHNKKNDAWIVIDGNVYDVTKYVELHPGGWLPISTLSGKDCTDAFANYHPARVYKNLLPQYLIGTMKDYKVTDFQKSHRALRQRLLEEGMFEIDPTYFCKLGVWLTALFITAIYLTITGENSRLQRMIGAFFMGFFWQQCAFIGHDAGHNSVTHNWNFDNNLGLLVGNLLTGIGTGWWKRSHNVHHLVCNSIEHDPDIQHMPLFAVTPDIFNGSSGHEHGKFWTTYHQKWVQFDSIARFMVSNQHWLFYPIMALARFNLYAQSYILLLDPNEPNSAFGGKKRGSWGRKAELVALLGFAAWFFGMVFYVMPVTSVDSNGVDTSYSPLVERMMYVLLSHAVAGVLHVQICLSHFSMATYHDCGGVDAKGGNFEGSDEWFRMQVATTMNIDCPWYMDWFHGGLQFQIEHHLWPRLPRHNLRYASKLVKEFCSEHNVHYHCPKWFDAQRELVASLREVALNARTAKMGDGGFYTSQLWDGLNASG